MLSTNLLKQNVKYYLLLIAAIRLLIFENVEKKLKKIFFQKN
jgi:hypothetical protein